MSEQKRAERFSKAVRRLEIAGIVAIRTGSQYSHLRAFGHLREVVAALFRREPPALLAKTLTRENS